GSLSPTLHDGVQRRHSSRVAAARAERRFGGSFAGAMNHDTCFPTAWKPFLRPVPANETRVRARFVAPLRIFRGGEMSPSPVRACAPSQEQSEPTHEEEARKTGGGISHLARATPEGRGGFVLVRDVRRGPCVASAVGGLTGVL